uniref:Uncharacterized protein n=1 Tax=Anguilla anguilla TaxID=7936 RepID=A0A0E9PEU6_ANGAN
MGKRGKPSVGVGFGSAGPTLEQDGHTAVGRGEGCSF